MEEIVKATELDTQVAVTTIKHTKDNTTIDRELKVSLENAAEQGQISSKVVHKIIQCQSLNDWSEPLSLVGSTTHPPYPIDALPPGIRTAVQEVTDFVQCPISLSACSALAVLSLVAQGLANVRRAEKLIGPISLYLLAIADSGERKTTADHYFSSPIREWEDQKARDMQTDVIKYEASIKAWNAKIDGITTEIKRHSKSRKPTEKLEIEMERLENEKPHPPRIPRLLYGDSTPEALAWALSNGWHSGGLLSSEAGIIFGSHGMSGESRMRSLALFNVLWDGGTLKVDRRTNGSFSLQGARLTMGLAVQSDTIHCFIETSKGLARNIGFLARFLITCPKSTQGERFFKNAPDNWWHLSSFHNRIEDLLNIPLQLNEAGEIDPMLLDLSPDAKITWIAFHDDIENKLKPGGDMADARDVASKAADIAARLAALFHIYENGLTGTIGDDHIQSSTKIVGWHLNESRRFLNEITLPVSLLNASKLNNWLVDYCNRNSTNVISTRDLQRLGPNSLRNKDVLEKAIEILVEAERIRHIDDVRHKRLYINPRILEVNM